METRRQLTFICLLLAVIALARTTMQGTFAKQPFEVLAGTASNSSGQIAQPAASPRSDPCNRMTSYRDLDFWVGKWDVFDKASGVKTGTNRVEKSLNNCVVVEHWEGTLGEVGSSVNTINPGSGKWQQDWVSGTGVVTHFEGGLSSGAMHFSGVRNMYGVQPVPVRLTLAPLPDGSVQQTGEAQSGDGRWAVSYDFVYRRAK
jgi:hypothetical protein